MIVRQKGGIIGKTGGNNRIDLRLTAISELPVNRPPESGSRAVDLRLGDFCANSEAFPATSALLRDQFQTGSERRTNPRFA
jgi:hypothetical protein